MKQSRHLLAQAVADKTLHIKDMKQLSREVAAYLLHEGLVDELDSLLRDVIAIRAEHGLVEAEAVSAHQLSDADLNDVRAILKEYYPHAKQVTVHQRLDANLVGGIKLVMPHQQLDESVRASISKFKSLTAERA
ncbi:MAG: F0F1 ATP synthase subunit delta [Candidatus Saccharibacteria bacterium]|nr:F0F1 ATP synthase subunit delta [Candidatus Saccharibacteria bacterium]